MNCDQAQEAMLCAGAPGRVDDAALATHVSSCERCRQQQAAAERLAATLHEMSAAPLPRPVEQRLRHALRREVQRPKARNMAVWALAASILLAVGIEVETRPSRTALDGVVAEVTVDRTHVTTVQLAFNSGVQLDDVRFSLRIPSGFELDGRPGESLVDWTGTLDPGPNVLAVPIRALGAHEGILVASIESGGSAKTFRVRLKSEKPAMQRGI